MKVAIRGVYALHRICCVKISRKPIRHYDILSRIISWVSMSIEALIILGEVVFSPHILHKSSSYFFHGSPSTDIIVISPLCRPIGYAKG